ncbi:hypothetical protein PENANT_c034G02821 [Penicillium antarcticum]|uniref:Uncharacterized protein n=1 Tax=Penicillium antarcticum TaxID=416450 RepID=A0A1V6PU73_9EURO|nr:hypothetical protein PENANT_c034G02821 [Penicillium antarcticum]
MAKIGLTSTETMSSAASTISTASTLKGADANKKWFSLLPSKTTDSKPKSNAEKKAIHHEAVATYLALR